MSGIKILSVLLILDCRIKCSAFVLLNPWNLIPISWIRRGRKLLKSAVSFRNEKFKLMVGRKIFLFNRYLKLRIKLSFFLEKKILIKTLELSWTRKGPEKCLYLSNKRCFYWSWLYTVNLSFMLRTKNRESHSVITWNMDKFCIISLSLRSREKLISLLKFLNLLYHIIYFYQYEGMEYMQIIYLRERIQHLNYCSIAKFDWSFFSLKQRRENLSH